MEAKEKSFGEIMQRAKVFKIPFFQRAYVWEKEHWEKFLNDLHESFKDSRDHFLGSVILKVSSGNNNFANVIDGQQRLTTFSILMKVLYDSLEEGKQQFFKECLFEAYTSDNSPRILHSRLDRETYMKVFKFSNKEILKLQTSDKMIECYQYFYKKIVDEKICPNENEKFEFMKFLKDSKILVSVCLDNKEDEQKIFDSINSSGEPLSSTDIIKNALFDRIIKESNEQMASELYGKYWENIFEKDTEKRDFWNKVIVVGRIKRVRSEIFLHAFAIIEGFFDPEKHNLENISLLYKKYIENKNIGQLEKFLMQIAEISKIYDTLPKIDKETLLSYNDWELRFFHIIEITKTNTILPLILILKQRLNTEARALESIFYLLEVFVLCNKNTKNYNKFFAKIVKNIPKNNDKIYDFIHSEITNSFKLHKINIEEWLQDIDNNNAKLLLFWIELYRESLEKDYKDRTGLIYSYTLEHLMPRSWQKHWKNIVDNEEEAKQLICQIGNMTLLKAKLNNELKNREWSIKLNGDGKVKNYISKSAVLSINKELLEIVEWNKNEIEKRTKKFIEDFFKIWDVEIFKK